MFDGVPESALCSNCGNFHIYSHECRYNMHGSDDPFKTSCAFCNTEIPSGADREGDKFKNLYCSMECKALGMETLVEVAQGL